MIRKLAYITLAAAVLGSACAPQVRRFPLADPLWVDQDQNNVSERPDEYYSGLMADGADKMALYPLAHVWRFPLPGEAVILENRVQPEWGRHRTKGQQGRYGRPSGIVSDSHGLSGDCGLWVLDDSLLLFLDWIDCRYPGAFCLRDGRNQCWLSSIVDSSWFQVSALAGTLHGDPGNLQLAR